jgi:glutathione S-transferase
MAEMQLPFGQLPLLQIDGLELVQSQAIVRYIAKRGNLIGSSAEEELKADMVSYWEFS